LISDQKENNIAILVKLRLPMDEKLSPSTSSGSKSLEFRV